MATAGAAEGEKEQGGVELVTTELLGGDNDDGRISRPQDGHSSPVPRKVTNVLYGG